MDVAGYRAADRLITGPLAESVSTGHIVFNDSAHRFVAQIRHHQPISIGHLTDWAEQEFSLPAEQASRDVQQFAMNAVDQGVLSLLPPREYTHRALALIQALPGVMRSLLMGAKLWEGAPRKRHFAPSFSSFLMAVLVTSLPYVAVPAAALAGLATWFVMAEDLFITWRSALLLGMFFTAMFATGILSHLVHEAAHYLFARQRRSKVFTVYRGGGAVGMTRQTADPTSEVMITLVGPLAGIATATVCATAWLLVLESNIWPVSFSRLEYIVAILMALVPAVSQLGNFFPGTADGNILLNNTLAAARGRT